MPYCTVCKIETDYEYDIALSNGEYLHYSCILMLQMQKHEIETVLRTQNSQLILSLFVPTEGAQQDIASETEIEDLRAKLATLESILTGLYDYLPCWPPDWEERKRILIRENGSFCALCDEEADVYLVHDIPVFEGGTNKLDELTLYCAECYRSGFREVDIFGTSTLKPSQSEFSEQFSAIQSAIDNDQRIQFDYKKPSNKRWMTRVVVPERLLNIPNSRESGETLCVEGFCELRQDTRVFALERMQNLEVIEDW
ncbi:MAG: WYL domain-containing protein [Candidatus Poribacteria bacterium]|nr:WYL domain-containing protein [Candidatus Poribacteria bacterium]